MKSRNLKVEETTHEVIEAKLMHALSNSAQVALLVTREDLDRIILGLRHTPDPRGPGILHALEQLRGAAFPDAQDVCWYCGEPAVASVPCAQGAAGWETPPRLVCASCRKKHEF